MLAVMVLSITLAAGCGAPMEFTAVKPRPEAPSAVAVPEDVAAFLAELGKAYGSKDSSDVRNFLAKDFLYQGMDGEAFMKHLAANQAYVEKMEIRPLQVIAKGEALEVTAYSMMARGPMAPSLQMLPLNVGATLVKENGQWRLRGNQQWTELGLYLHTTALSGVFPPADYWTYLSLIPKGWSIPDQPLVQLNVIEYRSMALPQVPYRLASLNILVKKGEQQAWHYVEMPETDWLAVEAGRALGFPKYVVELPVAREGDNGWKAGVRQSGKDLVNVRFAFDNAALRYLKDFGRDGLIVVPGGPPMTVSTVPIANLKTKPRYKPGWLTVAPGAVGRWKSLLPEGQRVPAVMVEYAAPTKLVITPSAKLPE